MADDKRDGGKTPPPGQPKKPSPIIDLKATEVRTSASGPVPDAGKVDASRPDPAKASPGPDAAKAAAGPAAPVKPDAPKPEPARTVADAAKAAATATAGTTSAPGASGTASKPTTANPAARPRTSAGGFLTHMAAGLAGAIAALAGSQVLDLSAGNGPSADLARRLAALEQAAPRAGGDASAKLGAAEQRLERLEALAKSLGDGQQAAAAQARQLEQRLSAQPATEASAPDRLAKLEEQIAGMVAAANADPRNAGRLPQLAQLTGKIGDVETALTTRTAQLRTELTQQMDQRFTRAGEQSEAARALLAQRAQSLEQSLKTITEEAASLRSGVDTLKADLDTRIKGAAKPSDVQTAVQPLAAKVAALETGMQTVVRSEQDRNATAGNILLSLELANLKRALDRGGKYADELAAVKALAGPKLDLAVLEAQSVQGVPSLAALGSELSRLAHEMLDAEAEPANATFAERMVSGLKSVVRVRKVDHKPGDTSTEAVIARMERGLKEGRVGDVIEEAKKLPEKAATPAAQWLKRLETRAGVDKALAALDASLKTSLAGGAAPKKGTN